MIKKICECLSNLGFFVKLSFLMYVEFGKRKKELYRYSVINFVKTLRLAHSI
jgi:hypothetical protein